MEILRDIWTNGKYGGIWDTPKKINDLIQELIRFLVGEGLGPIWKKNYRHSCSLLDLILNSIIGHIPFYCFVRFSDKIDFLH